MKINIGSGQCGGSVFANGWICVDYGHDASKPEWHGAEYLKFDITGPWPLPENSADCIFASHILEHVEYSKQRKIYQECFRVLKPGAPMRVICPDPRIFVRNWQAKNWNFVMNCYGPDNWKRNGYEGNPNKAFTDMFFEDNYDHVIVPSIDMVAIMAIRAGFSKVTEMPFGCTEFPQFFGDYEKSDSYEKSIDNRPVMSYYLEAVK